VNSAWRGVAIGMLVGGLGAVARDAVLRAGFWINVTESLPIGVYRVVHAPVTRGAYVLACAPEWAGRLARERGYVWRGPCPGGAAMLGKQVVAIAGDTVEVTDAGVMVNGKLLAKSAPLTRDTRGRTLPVVRERLFVLPGSVWLGSQWNSRSYDSRYFGTADRNSIRAVIVAVR
jgi:conjugative transfer signal peptidase TraF